MYVRSILSYVERIFNIKNTGKINQDEASDNFIFRQNDILEFEGIKQKTLNLGIFNYLYSR
jgi:hypothetical protein